MRILYYTIATGLGTGYSPIAPGTAGSILSLLLAFFVIRGNSIHLMAATIVLFGIGTISASFVENDRKIKDPQLVVVDEIVGMLIGVFFIPRVWWSYLISLLLFRVFDILKPFPINSMQKLGGGLGIMMDDVIAGIYAFIGMHLILQFV